MSTAVLRSLRWGTNVMINHKLASITKEKTPDFVWCDVQNVSL